MGGRAGFHRRVAMFGCEIDALTMEETVALVDEIANGVSPGQHVALNASGVVSMRDDSRLRDIVREASIVSADGQSIVWASRLLGCPLPERVAGPDLFLRLIGLAEVRGYPVYLVGASPSVLESACAALLRAHPNLVIAGSRDGYFGDEESDETVLNVRRSGARMLFVAMPTPRKEYWISENLARFGVPFCMGVGGTFDIVAGLVDRAPQWMQDAGLEWTYRLYREPRRMWKRYFIGNARFAFILTAALVRRLTGCVTGRG